MPERGLLAGVLNWNGAAFTEQCLKSLARTSTPDLEVVVVDDASTDGRQEELATMAGGRHRVVRHPVNRGVAAGFNTTLRLARVGQFEFAWLLNNDIEVAPDAVAHLLAFMRANPDVVAASPRIVGVDGTEQHAGGWLHGDGLETATAAEFDEVPGDPKWLSGCALLVRMSAIPEIGPFDERLFAYWEDVDFSFRAGRVGRLAAVPAARIFHHGSTTFGRRSPFYRYLMARNEWRVLKAHGLTSPGWTRRFLGRHLRSAAMLGGQGQRDASNAILAGIFDAIRGRRGRPARMTPPAVVERLFRLTPWKVIDHLDRDGIAMAGGRS